MSNLLIGLRTFLLFVSLFALPNYSFAENQTPKDPNAVFPVEELKIITGAGEFRFSIEVADEAYERQRGLMHRETMLKTHGMLFDFQNFATVNMWMKNTPLPLDMVFIKPDGIVATIATNTEPFSTAIISSKVAVSHVLELNAGMARLIGLKPGDKILHGDFSD